MFIEQAVEESQLPRKRAPHQRLHRAKVISAHESHMLSLPFSLVKAHLSFSGEYLKGWSCVTQVGRAAGGHGSWDSLRFRGLTYPPTSQADSMPGGRKTAVAAWGLSSWEAWAVASEGRRIKHREWEGPSWLGPVVTTPTLSFRDRVQSAEN